MIDIGITPTTVHAPTLWYSMINPVDGPLSFTAAYSILQCIKYPVLCLASSCDM